MSLADDLDGLSEYPKADESEYSPRVEFDGDGRGFIDTGTIQGDTPRDLGPVFRECLIAAGHDPDTVRIGQKLSESHWTQRNRIRVGDRAGEYETQWLHAYKFQTFLNEAASSPDIEAIVLRARAEQRPTTGPHWMVFQAGDQQLGKRSRDGSTEEIVARYIQSVEAAAAEFKQLRRHGVEGIQISLPGDCLEGVVSQKSTNMWLTQETIAEQTRILRRLMMYTIEQFAPLANQVYLDVVNGNHDQAQRMQNTYPGDGWATECAVSVSDALKLNRTAFHHVEVRVPDKWSGNMTVCVGDSVVTVVHGHQWSRTVGPMKWWADQAVNNQPAAASQVLQHGHWHEFQARSNAHRIAIGSPTFDCGSDWYREKTGATARRGGLVYLLRAGEVSRLTLV